MQILIEIILSVLTILSDNTDNKYSNYIDYFVLHKHGQLAKINDFDAIRILQSGGKFKREMKTRFIKLLLHFLFETVSSIKG